MRPLIRRFAGWTGADGNPLRRRIDRIENALRAALAVAFLVGAPLLAPAAGRLASAAGMREVHQESAWRQVNAVLLRSAPPQFYGYGAMATYWVPGRWRAPSGAARTGLVPTRTGAPSGSVVSMWVNWAGQPTGRQPMTTGLVKVRAILIEFVAVAGLGVLLILAAGLIRCLTNKRRITCWAMEWACFGPRWTARRWPRS
jgi:hypothetical protein